jgi:hypothetical protein
MQAARQALIAQLDRALDGLLQRRHTDAAVHAIRKELKRARAMLRLLRRCIGATAYRRDNVLLRDAARPLTPVRDAKVLIETLRELGRSTLRRGDRTAQSLDRVLRRERREIHARSRPQEWRAAVTALRAVERHVVSVPAARLNHGAPAIALGRAFKAARRAYACVKRRCTDQRLHEWRKQTKYLAAQLEIFLPLQRRWITKCHSRCELLATTLGDDHDLAVLHVKMRDHAPAAGLEHALIARRGALQCEAHRLAKKLYRIRARRVVAEIDAGLTAQQT